MNGIQCPVLSVSPFGAAIDMNFPDRETANLAPMSLCYPLTAKTRHLLIGDSLPANAIEKVIRSDEQASPGHGDAAVELATVVEIVGGDQLKLRSGRDHEGLPCSREVVNLSISQ